jgi:hypothetical protein
MKKSRHRLVVGWVARKGKTESTLQASINQRGCSDGFVPISTFDL